MMITWNLRLSIQLEILLERGRSGVSFCWFVFITSSKLKHQECLQRGEKGGMDLVTHNSKRSLKEETQYYQVTGAQ